MSILQTPALVLRVFPYGESSLVIHTFTAKQGKVAILAKGARQLKSPLRGYLEPFALLELIYYHKPTRELQILSKAERLHRWGADAFGWQFVLFGSVILELLDKLTTAQPDEVLFELTVTTFTQMETQAERFPSALLKFLLELAAITGYRFNLWSCQVCHRPLDLAFYDQVRAAMVCSHCRSHGTDSTALSSQSLQLLRALEQGQWESLPPLGDSADQYLRLVRLLIHYLGSHHDLDLKCKSLEVLQKSLEEKSGVIP